VENDHASDSESENRLDFQAQHEAETVQSRAEAQQAERIKPMNMDLVHRRMRLAEAAAGLRVARTTYFVGLSPDYRLLDRSSRFVGRDDAEIERLRMLAHQMQNLARSDV
jgi:hypothetical protein